MWPQGRNGIALSASRQMTQQSSSSFTSNSPPVGAALLTVCTCACISMA